MPDFQVATDELYNAAGRLGAAAKSLQFDYGGVNPSALGFPAPELALGLFVGGWSINTLQLSQVVSVVGEHLGGAGTNYDNAETANTCPAPRPS